MHDQKSKATKSKLDESFVDTSSSAVRCIQRDPQKPLEYTIKHFPLDKKREQLVRKPFFGRFDISKSLFQPMGGSFVQILKMFRMVPLALAAPFIFVNPAFAASASGAAFSAQALNYPGTHGILQILFSATSRRINAVFGVSYATSAGATIVLLAFFMKVLEFTFFHEAQKSKIKWRSEMQRYTYQ